MNIKLILAIAVILIIIALAFLTFKPTLPVTVTIEEASIIDDQTLTVTEEQLNAVSAEDPTFLTSSEDSIATDTSLFYYE